MERDVTLTSFTADSSNLASFPWSRKCQPSFIFVAFNGMTTLVKAIKGFEILDSWLLKQSARKWSQARGRCNMPPLIRATKYFMRSRSHGRRLELSRDHGQSSTTFSLISINACDSGPKLDPWRLRNDNRSRQDILL